LCRLRPQVAGLAVAGTDVGREHEVEVLDRHARKRGATGRAGDVVVGDELLDFRPGQRLGVLDLCDRLDEVVGAVGLAALGTLDEHVVEPL